MTYTYWCLQCRSFVGDTHFTQTGHEVHCIPSDAVQATRTEALKDAADRADEHIRQWQVRIGLREAIYAGEVEE